MKIGVSAITAHPGLARALQQFSNDLARLHASTAGAAQETKFQFMIVSLVDEPPTHLKDITDKKRPILHVQIGYDPEVFSHPLDRRAVLEHFAERCTLAIAKSRLLPPSEIELFLSVVDDWRISNTAQNHPVDGGTQTA